MVSLSRFVRSVRPQDFKAHLEINRISAPEELDWTVAAADVAELFLRSLDRLDDDHRDRLIVDAERISAMTDEPGQAALLALLDCREQLLTIEGAHARAHWLYVRSREAFRRAEEIRYADENREAQRLWDGFIADHNRGSACGKACQRQTAFHRSRTGHAGTNDGDAESIKAEPA